MKHIFLIFTNSTLNHFWYFYLTNENNLNYIKIRSNDATKTSILIGQIEVKSKFRADGETTKYFMLIPKRLDIKNTSGIL